MTQGCYFYKNIADKDLQNSFHAIAEKKRSLPLIGFVIKQKKDEVFRLGYAIDPKQSYRDNVFTSNLLLFNEFNHYFCREAQDLIAKVQNYAINLKDDFGSNFNNKDDIFDISLENKCQFLSRIQGKNLENVMKLSPREIECMKYLHQGLSTSQISEKMFLSPRTIETHIIHIKNKLNCHKKSDLYNYITLLQAAV